MPQNFSVVFNNTSQTNKGIYFLFACTSLLWPTILSLMSKGAARIPNILLHNKMDVTSHSLSWQNTNCQHEAKRMQRNLRASWTFHCFLPSVGEKQTYFHQAAALYCFSTADKLRLHFSGKKQTKELAWRCRCTIKHQRRKLKGEGFDHDKTGNTLRSLRLSGAHAQNVLILTCTNWFFRCFFFQPLT